MFKKDHTYLVRSRNYKPNVALTHLFVVSVSESAYQLEFNYTKSREWWVKKEIEEEYVIVEDFGEKKEEKKEGKNGQSRNKGKN